MTTILIIIFILLILVAVFATFAASYLYGANILLKKMAVESKRDRKRLLKSLNLWQNAYVRRAGGNLRPETPKPSEQQPSRRIVAASEVVAQMKTEHKEPKIETQSVPPAIKEEFLEKAGKFAR